MSQLHFEISKLDPRLVKGDKGDAFQRFVFELYEPGLPHLHPYPVGGKDGGIDHLTNAPGQARTVVECKFCGTHGFNEVNRRWKVTEGNLARNITLSAGPAQSQYAPWYRTDEPISRYIFVTSARLENQAHCDELGDLIRTFFHGLAATHPHLSHLSALIVEVNDWNYIEARLPPFLRFRWFIGERPAGLRLLASEDEAAQGFRAWLRSSNLPFYSRSQHLAIVPAPSGRDLPDEKALLAIVGADPSTLGLILVGRGGVGKTRLALEIGHVAAEDGWNVWVVYQRLKPEALDQLAARVEIGTRTLLVFDYVETHPEFMNIVQQLADIVDDTGLHIRYVATCRSSYYNSIKGADRQRSIALSMADTATEAWLSSYRHATVRHILSHANISIAECNIKACHDLPVLAAFLHWLSWRGRATELQSLLGEESFGRWVFQRIQLSFPGRNLDHSLARMIALFPFSSVGRFILTDDEKDLFYRLEQDGWIERADDPSAGEAAWQTAHDVMADQVAWEWLKSIGPAANEWCAELLQQAIRFNALPSALRSLQRLAEHLPVSEIAWEKMLLQAALNEAEAWKKIRSELLRTTLLSPLARVRVITKLNDLFLEAEVEIEFQTSLGELLRQLAALEIVTDLPHGELSGFFEIIRRAIPHQVGLQFLRAWAVICAPEEFSHETLAFIISRADRIATQYIICAWIEAGLEMLPIEPSVKIWCRLHSTNISFSFVASAWLKGGGDPIVIQPFLESWLPLFSTTPQASYVLTSWMVGVKEPGVVKKYLTQWLLVYGTLPAAKHVFEAWINHAKDPDTVEELFSHWLLKNGNLKEDCSILVAWLAHADSPEVVLTNVIQWLSRFGLHLDAHPLLMKLFSLSTLPEFADNRAEEWLREHGHRLEIEKESRLLLVERLKNTKPIHLQLGSVTRWLDAHCLSPLACDVMSRWLHGGGDADPVKKFVLSWIKEYGCEPRAVYLLGSCMTERTVFLSVEDSVFGWLEIHAQQQAAAILIASCLAGGMKKERVITYLHSWLRIHATRRPASKVLCGWLDCGGAPEMIESYMLRWLEHNASGDSATVVLDSWRRARGGNIPVYYFIEN